ASRASSRRRARRRRAPRAAGCPRPPSCRPSSCPAPWRPPGRRSRRLWPLTRRRSPPTRCLARTPRPHSWRRPARCCTRRCPGWQPRRARPRRPRDSDGKIAMPAAPTGAELERIAATDPTVAPLARLQVVALRAAEDRAWEDGIPSLPPRGTEDDAPRLHGASLVVDVDRLRALLRPLAPPPHAPRHPPPPPLPPP